jgi:hypothetical protein
LVIAVHVHAHVHLSLHGGSRRATIHPVMSQRCQCTHGSRFDRPRRRADREIVTLFALELLLMGFSVLASLLAQPSLAAIAGTGCISIAGLIGRRLANRGSGSRRRSS